jgi:hypothetical protein
MRIRSNRLDVDAHPDSAADPFIAEKLGFALLKEATVALANLRFFSSL